MAESICGDNQKRFWRDGLLNVEATTSDAMVFVAVWRAKEINPPRERIGKSSRTAAFLRLQEMVSICQFSA
jgi:hypothetical protein